MSTPNQMFTHELNPTKGWPSPYALDHVGELASSTINTVTVRAGMLCHIWPNAGLDQGKLALGCSIPANGVAPMPMFLFPNGADFDVVGDDGNIVGAPSTGSTWTGTAMALVATGSYELETTEFVTGGGLQTGSMLVAAGGANLGKVQAIGDYTFEPVTVVGVVSDGVIKSDQPSGPARLRFYPIYLPLLNTSGNAGGVGTTPVFSSSSSST